MPLFERTDGSRHLRWNLPEIFSTRLSKNVLFIKTSLKASCQNCLESVTAEKMCLRHQRVCIKKYIYEKTHKKL